MRKFPHWPAGLWLMEKLQFDCFQKRMKIERFRFKQEKMSSWCCCLMVRISEWEKLKIYWNIEVSENIEIMKKILKILN